MAELVDDHQDEEEWHQGADGYEDSFHSQLIIGHAGPNVSSQYGIQAPEVLVAD